MSYDSILKIEKYISTHKGDDCGTWEFEHAPYIEELVDNLDSEEYKNFSISLFTWSDFHLASLADPLLEAKGDWYLYTKIFSLLTCPEELDYLAENLSIFPEKIKTWDRKILKNTLYNLIQVRSRAQLNSSWFDSYDNDIKKLQSELNKS